MEIFAIYFPSYHSNPHYSLWYRFDRELAVFGEL